MKRRVFLKLTLFVLVLFSCKRLTFEERMIRDTIGMSLDLEFVKEIIHGNEIIAFNNFNSIYPYLSVVYLKNGCSPCYDKFLKWTSFMDTLDIKENYNVLFIYSGQSYNEFADGFIEHAPDFELNDIEYFLAVDSSGNLQSSNPFFSDWILNKTMLINSENKVLLIGEPFASEQIFDLYLRVLRNE